MKIDEFLHRRAKGQTHFGGHEFLGTDFSNLDLSGLDFTGCDMAGAQFIGCNLVGTNFRRANMSGANLRGADLGILTRSGVALIKSAGLTSLMSKRDVLKAQLAEVESKLSELERETTLKIIADCGGGENDRGTCSRCGRALKQTWDRAQRYDDLVEVPCPECRQEPVSPSDWIAPAPQPQLD